MAQMMAPNPRRNGGIDRVVVIGRSDDGLMLTIASIDGIARVDLFKQRYFKYFTGAAHLKLIALMLLLVGVVGAFFWHWWAILIGIAAVIIANRISKAREAEILVRIVREEPGAAELLASSGLIWEAPARTWTH